MSNDTADPATMSSTTPQPSIRWPVLCGSAAIVLAIAIWAMITPETAGSTIETVVGWISNGFGWFYILLLTALFVFVVYLGFSRYKRTRLGPDDSRPQFSTFSWVSMLFAAGIGTDLMFYSVADPMSQYLDPPRGDGETLEAAREASVWTMFHYGISGWSMYAVMGMALAFFAYRKGLPLAIRSVLYPIFGKRVYGRLGDTVDIAAVIGTIFGIAASLGVGVVLLNYGLTYLFGIPEGSSAQIGLVILAVLMATLSGVSGIDKGIKRLSQINVLLAVALSLYVLVTGKTITLLNGLVANLGDYVRFFPAMTMETFAFDRPEEWLDSWTLFFWAWWIAWAPFIGLFLARISRGRTIGQFVFGTLVFPFCYILMWVSIFGNSAIEVVRGGNADFGKTAVTEQAHGFYGLLDQYPGAVLTAGVATFVGLLFYVTSADSGSLVMANLSSRLPDPQHDARRSLRVFWAVATGLLTISMLLLGGVPALQNTTIIMALPFSFVLVLVMIGFYKALRKDYEQHSGPPDALRSWLPARLSKPGLDGSDALTGDTAHAHAAPEHESG